MDTNTAQEHKLGHKTHEMDTNTFEKHEHLHGHEHGHKYGHGHEIQKWTRHGYVARTYDMDTDMTRICICSKDTNMGHRYNTDMTQTWTWTQT